MFYESFDAFLRYEWTVIVVTDTETDRLHIVTHCETHIQEFVKMIQTRYVHSCNSRTGFRKSMICCHIMYGTTLPEVGYNALFVTPSETSRQRTQIISSAAAYKGVHGTIWLEARKAHAISGEPEIIREKTSTFLAVDFEW